ncbi:MAG: hypothetical protein AAFR93_15350, partial [Pseudomonadota bacterium]
EEEGKRNFSEVSPEESATAIEMIRHVSSTGYLRKRLPQELTVLQGGLGVAAAASDAAVAEMGEVTVEAMSETLLDQRAKAKMQGYEGDPCGECGNFTLVRNGTCMKCNTCGGTSGCS